MRFSTFSLFALSSLFVGAFAAPTAHQVRDVAIAEVEQRDTSVAAVEERTVPEIVVILDGLVTEVFSYTASINVTVSSCEGISISVTKKVAIIASIQVYIQKIIAAFAAACLKIYKLELLELIAADFQFIISASVKILIECVYTFLYACAILKISIIELLGATFGLFLHAYISFLIAIGGCVVGFIEVIKSSFTINISVIVEVFGGFGEYLACL